MKLQIYRKIDRSFIISIFFVRQSPLNCLKRIFFLPNISEFYLLSTGIVGFFDGFWLAILNSNPPVLQSIPLLKNPTIQHPINKVYSLAKINRYPRFFHIYSIYKYILCAYYIYIQKNISKIQF